MGNYKKLGDGHYQVETDQGSYEIKPSVVGVAVSLSEMSRTASYGNDFAEPEKGFTLSRVINARWEPDEYYFELISEEGKKRASLWTRQ